MLTRKDLEDILGCKMTDEQMDEQWKKYLKNWVRVIKIWEEDHPLDD